MIRLRRLIFIPLFFGLAFAGLSLYWWIAAGEIRALVEARLAMPSQDGPTIRAAGMVVSGYPFDLTITLQDVTLQGLPQNMVRVALPTVRVTRRLWAQRGWHAEAAEGLRLTLAGPYGHRADLSFAAAEAKLTLPDGQDAASRARTELRLMAEQGTVLFDDDPGKRVQAAMTALTVQIPTVPVQNHMIESLGLTLSMRDVSLPRKIGRLGDKIARFDLDVGVLGNLTVKSQFPMGLADWRDDGGTLEVRRVLIDWGPLSLSGDGTLALDKRLQPIAALSATLRGWPMLIDSLVDERVSNEADIANARAGLALLAGPGGPTVPLRAPITVQNGVVSLEKAKIAKLQIDLGPPS